MVNYKFKYGEKVVIQSTTHNFYNGLIGRVIEYRENPSLEYLVLVIHNGCDKIKLWCMETELLEDN